MYGPMTRQEHRLLRHLFLAVLIKLTILVGLWWIFLRDVGVTVDTERTITRFDASAQPNGTSR